MKSIPDECDGTCVARATPSSTAARGTWTLILDDDISSIHYFEDGKDFTMTPDQIAAMVCHGFDLASRMGVTLWGINQNSDEMAYCAFRPFNFLAPILGPFNGHLAPELRYDESVRGKDDYDFWLQTIRKYHKTLRFNKYHYIHDHGKRPGGFVGMRTMEVEEAGVKRMREKWGKVFAQAVRRGPDGTGRRTRGNILNSLVQGSDQRDMREPGEAWTLARPRKRPATQAVVARRVEEVLRIRLDERRVPGTCANMRAKRRRKRVPPGS